MVVSSRDASRPRLFAFVTIDGAAALNIGEAACPEHPRLSTAALNYMVLAAIEVLDNKRSTPTARLTGRCWPIGRCPAVCGEAGGGRGGGGGGDGGSGAKQEPKTPEETLMLETW